MSINGYVVDFDDDDDDDDSLSLLTWCSLTSDV